MDDNDFKSSSGVSSDAILQQITDSAQILSDAASETTVNQAQHFESVVASYRRSDTELDGKISSTELSLSWEGGHNIQAMPQQLALQNNIIIQADELG